MVQLLFAVLVTPLLLSIYTRLQTKRCFMFDAKNGATVIDTRNVQ